MKTTTFGTGELIRDALERGCLRFVIGLGGSATNDAGLGMLQALGFRFFDKEGHEVGSMKKGIALCGALLSAIHRQLFCPSRTEKGMFHGGV